MGSININYEEKTESHEMESLPKQQGCDTSELKREVDELNKNLTASDNLQFKFGKDGDGNYGYYGADGSLIPFKSGTIFLGGGIYSDKDNFCAVSGMSELISSSYTDYYGKQPCDFFNGDNNYSAATNNGKKYDIIFTYNKPITVKGVKVCYAGGRQYTMTMIMQYYENNQWNDYGTPITKESSSSGILIKTYFDIENKVKSNKWRIYLSCDQPVQWSGEYNGGFYNNCISFEF